MLGVLFFIFLPWPWTTTDVGDSSLFALGFLIVAIIGAWNLAHAGQFRMAAVTVLATLFLIPTYLNFVIYQTIRSPDVWVYFILIPLAGLLLGRRAMLYFALVCLFTLLALYLLEASIVITPTITLRAGKSDFMILAVSLLLNTLLLHVIVRRTEDKTTEAHRSLERLLSTNMRLEESQAALQRVSMELEQRVQERTEALQVANRSLQAEAVTRQQLMNALQRSEANWRSLVQHAPELIVTLATDGRILFSNRDVRGCSAAELEGLPAITLHGQLKHQQCLQKAIAQVVQEGHSVSYESEDTEADHRRWAVNRLSPIYQNGKLGALILISTDISEQKQAEMAMLHSQKLESLGVMAGGVAHDFNNLLTAIVGQASLALSKSESRDNVQEYLHNILLVSQRATDLTRQMLNYAGRSVTDFKPLNLNRLIRENLQFFSASIPKAIQLQAQEAPDLPLLVGDVGQIQQLIMNLILNAADAIGEQGGMITISTANYTLRSEEVGLWNWSGQQLKSGAYTALEIVDTGCGMDSDTLSKIFDPFFTTKFTGRGLGLASVMGIVRTHHGGLQVTSALGLGTTFRILFPVSDEVEREEDYNLMSEQMIGFDGKLVLIIDDEDDVRNVTAEILELSGIETIQAINGANGLELFRRHVDDLDLVLLDLSMPGMGGEEVAKQIWQLKPTTPITMLSGYDQHEVVRRLGQSHNLSFLQKPYSMDGLLQEINRQLKNSPRTVTATVKELQPMF
jgi:PAS domain S-box-containing protein